MSRHLTIALLILTIVSGAAAQQMEDGILFRRAKALRRAGDLDGAAKIYEQLHETRPNNNVFYTELKEVYTEADRYEDLLSLLNANLKAHPDNWRTEAEIGDAYLKLGRKDDGLRVLLSLVERHPNSMSVYRIVEHVLSRNRLFDEVEKIYAQAQLTSDNPAPFMKELGRYYTARLNYGSATDEYIKYLLLDPKGYPYVRRQLSRFQSDEATTETVIERIEEHMAANPGGGELRRLLADYYFKAGDFRGVLDEAILFEGFTGFSGEYLYEIALNLRKEKQFDLSTEALRTLMSRNPDSRHFPKAFFNLAETYELAERARSETGDVEPTILVPYEKSIVSEAPVLPRSLAMYDSVATKYPRSLMAARAYYRMGEIHFHRLQNLDEAMRSYEKAIRTHRDSEITDKSRFRLAEIEMERGDLSRAGERFKSLAENARSEKIRFQCLLSSAKLEYFTASFDSALHHLNDMILELDMDDPLMNDVLELSMFIETNRKKGDSASEEAMRLFARGELFEARRRYSEAQVVMRNVESDFPASSLADDAAYRSARLTATMGRFADAVELLEEFLRTRSDSDLADVAMVAAAEIYEYELDKPTAAIGYYERLLVEYPRSFLADDVREKLRTLSEKERVN